MSSDGVFRDDEGGVLLECDCHGSHFVRFSPDPDDADAYLTVEDFWAATQIRKRLKAAWKVLRGGHGGWSEVILTPPAAIALSDALKRWAEGDG